MDDTEITDTHIHVWTDNDPRYPMHVPPNDYPWWRGTIEDYICDMDAAGINRAVIVQIPYHEYDHSYALWAKERYPERFAIAGLLDIWAKNASNELLDMKNKHNIQGIRFSPGENDHWLDSEKLDPLWRTAGEMRLPMILQIGTGHYNELVNVVKKHPNTTFALDHLGGVGITNGKISGLDALVSLAAYNNIYVKTSHLYGLNRTMEDEKCIPVILERLRGSFGAERLMFGSNWPLVRQWGGLKRSVEGFVDAISKFSVEEKMMILSGTAARVYSWD